MRTLCRPLLALSLVVGTGVAWNAEASPPSLLSASAAVAADAPAPAPVLLSDKALSPRLHELSFRTPYMQDPDLANPYANGTTGLRILLPTGYSSRSARRWPVLYLLHGCCDSIFAGSTSSVGYRSWTVAGNAEALTRSAPFIIVMPDGLNAGWYSDSYGVAGEGGPRIESYLTLQLIPWVDAHFATRADRAHRAIAGLSMGGFGAMSLAARHPDLFSATYSFSGQVNSRHNADSISGIPLGPVPQPITVDGLNALDARPPYSTWGPRATEEIRTRMHNPVDLVRNLAGLAITLRTGNGVDPAGGSDDSTEKGVHDNSVDLHQALSALKIQHLWDDYGPGTHSWPYWSRDLGKLVEPLTAHFAQHQSEPASFAFTEGEQAFSVYGLRVAGTRSYLELTNWTMSPGRLSVTGSGTFHLTTPPAGAPGARYRVQARRGALREALVVRADRAGRLSFAVDTGVASTGQQFRAATSTHQATVTVSWTRV